MKKNLPALSIIYLFIYGALCFAPAQVIAQSIFQKTYTGAYPDESFSIQTTADSGFVLAGQTTSYGHGNSDMFVFKTDKDGSVLWAKAIGDTAMDVAASVALTPDGGFALAGMTTNFGTSHTDTNVIIYKAGGGSTFTEVFGGSGKDVAQCIQTTRDSGYIVVGTTFSFDPDGDIYAIRLDKGGNLLWEQTIGGGLADYGHSVRQTADGGFIIAGSTLSYGAEGGTESYLVKINADGNVAWGRAYGTSFDYNAEFNDVIETPYYGAGYVATGYITPLGSPGTFFLTVVIVDSAGNLVWGKKYDDNSGQYSYGNSLVKNVNNEIYVVGCTASSDGGEFPDVMLFHSTISGSSHNEKGYGGPAMQIGYNGKEYESGKIAIAATDYSNPHATAYLLKTGYGGNTNCASYDKTLSFTGTAYTPTAYSGFLSSSMVTGHSVFNCGSYDITPSSSYFCYTAAGPSDVPAVNNDGNISVVLYPNPASSGAEVKLTLNSSANVSINLYDLQGKLISEVANKILNTGENSINCNTGNLSDGLYFVTVQTPVFSKTLPLSVMR